MKKFGRAFCGGVFVLGLSMAGCQPAPPTATPAEKAMHDKANEAGESLKEAGEKTVDAAKAAGAVIEEKVGEGVDKTKQAVEDVKRDFDSPAK